MTLTAEQLILLAIGAAAGLLLGLLIASILAMRRIGLTKTQIAILETQLSNEHELTEERQQALDLASRELASTFDHLASRSLQQNNTTFLQLAHENLGRFQTQARADLGERQKAVEHLVKPVAEALDKTQQQIAKVERDRLEAFGNIKAQLHSMNIAQENLQAETANLVGALKRPEVRGRWGEVTLKRLVELAGMVEHCDFSEQVHTVTEDGVIRPDMMVHLPEDRELVVDVKTPLDAYLAAAEAKDDATRQAQIARHARHVRERVRELSTKAYWKQFSHSPDFIILFLPGDQFLSSALTEDPALLDDALGQKIILATPSSFMALLKTVSYGWRQVALARNAEHISALAETLHKRIVTFTDHVARMGNALGTSVDAYNRAVGSLERNVLPGARKFTELGIREAKAITQLDSIETKPRDVNINAADEAAETNAGTDASASPFKNNHSEPSNS